MMPSARPTVRELTCATNTAEIEGRETDDKDPSESEIREWELVQEIIALDGEELSARVEGLVVLTTSDDHSFLDRATIDGILSGNLFEQPQATGLQTPIVPHTSGSKETRFFFSTDNDEAEKGEHDGHQDVGVEAYCETTEETVLDDNVERFAETCAEIRPPLVDLTLTDSDSDEEVPRPPRRRLRCFDEHFEELILDDEDDNTQRPLLPTVPAVHPCTGAFNMYDPSEPIDPDAEYDVYSIMDRAYEKPYRAYLVQWCDPRRRFIASWVWELSLHGDGFEAEMRRVDKWKDGYPSLTYGQFNQRFPSTYTASSTGRCFYDAVRLACIIYGDRALVPVSKIERFIVETKIDASEGISTRGIRRFAGFLKKTWVTLAVNKFQENLLTKSLNNWHDLARYPLPAGVYVVGASCVRNIKHCFVLRVHEDDVPARSVFDDLNEKRKEKEYSEEPLAHLQWIRRVGFIRKVERVGSVKRLQKKPRKLKKKQQLT